MDFYDKISVFGHLYDQLEGVKLIIFYEQIQIGFYLQIECFVMVSFKYSKFWKIFEVYMFLSELIDIKLIHTKRKTLNKS